MSDDEIERVARKVSIYGANSADLDVLCPPNRWAAFTTPELKELEFTIANEIAEERGPDYPLSTAIIDEIRAELERRQA